MNPLQFYDCLFPASSLNEMTDLTNFPFPCTRSSYECYRSITSHSYLDHLTITFKLNVSLQKIVSELGHHVCEYRYARKINVICARVLHM